MRHPESVAAKLALTGRRFPGPELAAMGVAYACVPDEEVLPGARALAAELASYPAGAAARIKATMRAYNDASANAWFDRAIAASPSTRREERRITRRKCDRACPGPQPPAMPGALPTRSGSP